MKRLQETKAQRWRALACLKSGEEALICLGSSSVQVKDYYTVPWFEIFEEDVRKDTEDIVLQRWSGIPDLGHWVTQNHLPIP